MPIAEKQIVVIKKNFDNTNQPTLKKSNITTTVELKVINTSKKRITRKDEKQFKKILTDMVSSFDNGFLIDMKIDGTLTNIRDKDRSLIKKISYISMNIKTK